VYEPRAADSEERSAAWAARVLAEAGAARDRIDRVSRLVLATTHADPAASGDAALVADVDLAILGAPRPRFLEYESQVGREYAWLPGEAFRAGRAALLEALLARPRIYATELFAERFEAAARANLRDALTRLRAG